MVVDASQSKPAEILVAFPGVVTLHSARELSRTFWVVKMVDFEFMLHT